MAVVRKKQGSHERHLPEAPRPLRRLAFCPPIGIVHERFHALGLEIENLFFAFFYNALGIPMARVAIPVFSLLLSPIIAGAAMSLSSITVIGNALRLRKVRM